ncbi:hypothetical protein A2U01_0061322, partial [Trifolium medium]|nr:hypothetical protein [Trifolium medium]
MMPQKRLLLRWRRKGRLGRSMPATTITYVSMLAVQEKRGRVLGLMVDYE